MLYKRRPGREPAHPLSDEGVQPQRVSRIVRCPHCRQAFSTSRRWQMACPDCGYEWDEANNHRARDDLVETVEEHAVFWTMWLLLIGIGVGAFAIIVVFLDEIGFASPVLAAVIFTPVLLIVAFLGSLAFRDRNGAVVRTRRW